MGGVWVFVAVPDTPGLRNGLVFFGDRARGTGGGDLRGDLGGDLSFRFLYRDGAFLLEGRFRGTMNRSVSLSDPTGSIRGAVSLVIELSLGLNSIAVNISIAVSRQKYV
jgi:hypothetical protein